MNSANWISNFCKKEKEKKTTMMVIYVSGIFCSFSEASVSSEETPKIGILIKKRHRGVKSMLGRLVVAGEARRAEN